MTRSLRAALATLALSGCADPTPAPLDATVRDVSTDARVADRGADADPRSDDEIVRACVACHDDVGARWQHLSSHRLLFHCEVCHAPQRAEPGPGHVAVPACGRCHSEQAHPAGSACAQCHTPHGTANAFLVREQVEVPGGMVATVHVTRPEGASLDGLARAGVDGGVAGTGLCEVCHTRTRHYDRAGAAAPHRAEDCAQCHAHAAGFAAPVDD